MRNNECFHFHCPKYQHNLYVSAVPRRGVDLPCRHSSAALELSTVSYALNFSRSWRAHSQ